MIFETLITFLFFALAAAVGVLFGRGRSVFASLCAGLWVYLLLAHSDSLGPKMIEYFDVADPGMPLILGSVLIGMVAAIADLTQQILRHRLARLATK